MRKIARRYPEDHCGAMGLVASDDNWKIPDELWSKIEPLLPPGKPHPLGCHNSRVPNRKAMNAILFVLRTGIQWNALNGTGLCSSSSAHRRFVEWAVNHHHAVGKARPLPRQMPSSFCPAE